MKNRIYFFESNVPMDKCVYLPLVSGLLQAYAQSFPEINEQYEFMPYIFMRDTPENMIKDVVNPFMMCFSVCIWNHQLSLAVAKLIKEKYPKCIIVFGGPQITDSDKPYCDYIIKEEGEKKYVELLGRLSGRDIDCSSNNLNDYPSPYTLGLYNEYLNKFPAITFQAIVETNRGCPFTCSFCYWGQGFEEKKVRHHSLQHVQEEAEWIGKNKIKYVFMADANYGMYDRDIEVAKIYVKVKEKYGYPEKIRVCYGKNKEEKVFETAKILHEANLSKAVTLARQSNNDTALSAIKRSNIKLSVYDNLAVRYNNAGIPTYTEIILGLPGETLDSFMQGVQKIISTPTQLFIYHCSVLPNTGMSDPEYIKNHGIKTVRVPLSEVHAALPLPGYVTEYEDIIIQTNTMSMSDWIRCAVYAWKVQLEHSFDIDEIPQHISDWLWSVAIGITQGGRRVQHDERFGNVWFEPEEMAYLKIMDERELIEGDKAQWAKVNVIWNRKSRVKKKELV